MGEVLTWHRQLQCLPKECRLKVHQQLLKLKGTATTTAATAAAAAAAIVVLASALLLLLPELQCIEALVETGKAYRVKSQQPEQPLHVNSTSSTITATTPWWCCCCCGAGGCSCC